MNFDLKHTDRSVIAIAEKKKIDISEAEKLINNSRVILMATEELCESFTLQVAFITCYNASCRIFKGGVVIDIPERVPNLLNFGANTFNELLHEFPLPADPQETDRDIPTITFGRPPCTPHEVQLICSGWVGGINYYDSPPMSIKNNGPDLSIGPCLAASYALFWAFNSYFGVASDPNKESFSYSLWSSKCTYWWENTHIDDAPTIKYIPNIWLVGLGHLGQAYLWVLANLKGVSKFKLLLQDDDKLGPENLGAQLLSCDTQLGKHKTRICAAFLERLGFESQIIEKKFNQDDQIDPALSDFKVLIAGLDNLGTRRQIVPDRFEICLDGATNGLLSNFDSFTFRNLIKSDRSPSRIWVDDELEAKVMHKHLYQMIEQKGGCGQLSNIGISTPFVGLFGASILIAELLKELLDLGVISTFTGKLRTPNSYSHIKVPVSVPH